MQRSTPNIIRYYSASKIGNNRGDSEKTERRINFKQYNMLPKQPSWHNDSTGEQHARTVLHHNATRFINTIHTLLSDRLSYLPRETTVCSFNGFFTAASRGQAENGSNSQPRSPSRIQKQVRYVNAIVQAR